jgi:cellulose synthase (UDP-forming)
MNSSLSVDVFLPVCGKPLDVLSNTWYGVQEVIEHNKNLVIKPWVLDDAASPEVHILADLFKFNYLVRDNRPYLKKAGNLRWAFQRTDGEYILILDADFRPLPEILDHLLPYMLDNPRCPIVQTPQFLKQTLAIRLSKMVQRMFKNCITG